MRRKAVLTAVSICAVIGILAAVVAWGLLDPRDTLCLQRRLIGRRAWAHKRINREIREQIAEDIAELEHAVQAGDDRPEVLVALAEAYESIGRDRSAFATVCEVLAEHPNNSAARELHIRLLWRRRLYDRMERMIDEYTARFPGDTAIWLDTSLLYDHDAKDSPVHAKLAKDYFKALRSGEELPRWSEYCAERGYPLWSDTEQGPAESDN